MIDPYGRNIHYLRISVTDRCNLRCGYCMPEEGVEPLSHEEILSFDEIIRLVRIMAGMGVNRIRLTGGEPLVRKNIEVLAQEIKSIPGIDWLAFTTNGVLLEKMAPRLLEAGVDGLNISMDTTDPERFAVLTCRDEWKRVKAGLDSALALPFKSIKINSVLSPLVLEPDWLSVVALAKNHPIDVRLIEWMPMAGETQVESVTADEALRVIDERYGPLAPLPHSPGAGPADYYSLPGFQGRVGMIPAMSHQFCDACNRVRLTATGDLKLCLFYDVGIPLRELLRSDATDREIAEAIQAALRHKPLKHHGERRKTEIEDDTAVIHSPVGMSGIGG